MINSFRKICLVIFLFFPFLIFAANTITFTGEVTDQTCQVEVNGSSSPIVILDSVPITALNAVAQVAGATPFTLSLTNCAASTSTDETFRTLFQTMNATAAGNLPNTATGGAQGVSLQLLDSVGGNPIVLSSGAVVQGGNIVLKKGDTSASKDFAVQYYAETSGVTAGAVTGAVTYTIRYE